MKNKIDVQVGAVSIAITYEFRGDDHTDKLIDSLIQKATVSHIEAFEGDYAPVDHEGEVLN